MSDSELTSKVLRLSVDCQLDSLTYINYNIIEEVYYYRCTSKVKCGQNTRVRS